MMKRNADIRLLTLTSTGKIWKTLKGRWLVGITAENESLFLGPMAADQTQWGYVRWGVIEAENGKYVVYRYDLKNQAGVIDVHDSLSAMHGRIPKDVMHAVELKLGIASPER